MSIFLIVNSGMRTYPALLHDPKMYPSGSIHMSFITVDALSDSYDSHWIKNNTDSITLTTPEVLRTSNSKILLPHATNNCLVMRGLWHRAVILFSKNPSRTAIGCYGVPICKTVDSICMSAEIIEFHFLL